MWPGRPVTSRKHAEDLGCVHCSHVEWNSCLVAPELGFWEHVQNSMQIKEVDSVGKHNLKRWAGAQQIDMQSWIDLSFLLLQ